MRRTAIILFLSVLSHTVGAQIHMPTPLSKVYDISTDYASLLPEKNRTYINNNIQLDSIYEQAWVSIFDYHYKTYYYYNEHTIDSTLRLYYNTHDEYRGVYEKTTYYKNLLIKQFDLYHNANGSSELMNYEKYTYSDDLIIKKEVEKSTNPKVSYTEEFWYDNQNRLIKSTGYDDFYGPDSTFYYYDMNKLKYKVHKVKFAEVWYSNVHKYFFEETDSSRLKTVLIQGFMAESLILDTISFQSEWASTDEHYEELNENGQRIFFSFNYTMKNVKYEVMKANYSYNENGYLDSISYYTTPVLDRNAPLTETKRIIINYNKNNTIKEFAILFYDAKTFTWEIEQRRKYYYNNKLLNLNNNKHSEIRVYPNPATSYIHIKNRYLINNNFRIFNVKGELIKTGRLVDQTINIKELSNGVYMLHLNTIDKPKRYKFIKL